ncbi:MAG: PAS domain S-box protein [Candidatus Magnetominusculus sp. LBB02]|nr:PAS domain S-box protein [Candidatus Magnetominusculus sp. LBB02]
MANNKLLKEQTASLAKAPRLMFIVVAIFIAAVGYVVLANQINHMKSLKQDELSAIASLKIEQILKWKKDIYDDAALIYDSPLVAYHVEEFIKNRDAKLQMEMLSSLLMAAVKHSELQRAMLIDKDGRLLISTQEGDSLNEFDLSFFKQAADMKEVVISDIYLNPMNAARVTVAIPILLPGHAGNVIAAVLTEVDPNRYLFPIIQRWPTPSATAETLLIRREGNDVIYLNTLRHKANKPLTYRIPIDKFAQILSVMAAKGKEGVVEGRDYRGKSVFAVLMRVPDTKWFIESKVDTEEIIQPMWQFTLLLGIIVLLAIWIAFLFIRLLWHRKNAVLLSRQFESESQLRKLYIAVEQSHASIVITDRTGTIEYVNPKFTKITGYAADEVIGQNPRILKSGTTPPELYVKLWAAVTGGRQWRGELTNKRKDGSLYLEKMLISPITDDKGTVTGFVAVKEDITQSKMRESMLLLYERQAKMGEMLSVIAHQWKQPLSAISASISRLELEAALGQLNTETLNAAFDKMKFQIQHLSETINDFRSFLKPDKEKTKTTIADILHKTLRIMQEHFEDMGITIEQKAMPDIQVETYADEMTQVFLCIMENSKEAFQLRKTVSPLITIDVYEDNAYVAIEIDDNAGGIPPAQIENIFLPYFTTKPELKGTGLGLYMGKLIVEEHCGGIITVANKGQGTLFTIKIPILAASAIPD